MLENNTTLAELIARIETIRSNNPDNFDEISVKPLGLAYTFDSLHFPSLRFADGTKVYNLATLNNPTPSMPLNT